MVKLRLLLCSMAAILVIGCGSREARIHDLRARYPQWDQATIEKLADRRIEVGMTEEMVRAVMRKPESVTMEKDLTIWEYSMFVPGSDGYTVQRTGFVIVFQNGKVIETRGDQSRVGAF